MPARRMRPLPDTMAEACFGQPAPGEVQCEQ
jgi:hypothetical protein